MGEAVRIDPDVTLLRRVMESGGGDLKKCYQCATCASVCPLSPEENGFPRQHLLWAQWGMKDKLVEDPGPWQCFYCGECSKRCPRGANPGEAMMALRRYLTTQYDWTGLSALMYGSAFWEIGVLAIVALVIVALFTIPQTFGFGLLHQAGPAALAHVNLADFAPKEIVHLGDNILAALLGVLVLSNAARMFLRLTRNSNIPMRVYLAQLPHLVYQGITQARWKDCADPDGVRNWLRHLFLVTGYGTIFTLVVVFLPWFQIENSSFHWTSILGYYATGVLLVTTGWILMDRARKRTEMHRFSHLSDWLFPILLFLTALSGIMEHIFRLADMAMPTYVMYTAHLAIAVPMLVVEVPFGKWAHLLYRPVALYVVAVKASIKELPIQEVAAAGQTAG
jgi:ferredoxin